jgi:hypothetical protein
MVIHVFCTVRDVAATVFEKSQPPKTTTASLQNCLSAMRIDVFVQLHINGTVNHIKTECWQNSRERTAIWGRGEYARCQRVNVKKGQTHA